MESMFWWLTSCKFHVPLIDNTIFQHVSFQCFQDRLGFHEGLTYFTTTTRIQHVPGFQCVRNFARICTPIKPLVHESLWLEAANLDVSPQSMHNSRTSNVVCHFISFFREFTKQKVSVFRTLPFTMTQLCKIRRSSILNSRRQQKWFFKFHRIHQLARHFVCALKR